MNTNMTGRVDNVAFRAKSDVLLPLFEALSNALDSTDEADVDASIIIAIERQGQLQLENSGKQQQPIANISITDNGVGFNNDNIESFVTLDSAKKRVRGGKGIGRLCWLKTFDEVHVESIFDDEKGKRRARAFFFKLPNGLDPTEYSKTRDATGEQLRTTVKLVGYKSKFEKEFPKRIATLKSEILKTYLPDLMFRESFKILITDSSEEEPALITEADVPEREQQEFEINGEKFTSHHLKVAAAPEGHHIYYCAVRRAIGEPEKLKFLGTKKIGVETEDQKPFFYVGYITSAFLDKNVDPERTRFTLEEKRPKDADLLEDTNIYFEDVKSHATDAAKAFLTDNLERMQEAKMDRVEEVLQGEMSGFAYLREKSPDVIASLSVEATTEEIKEKLALAHFRNRANTERDVEELIARVVDKTESPEDFEKECVEKLPDLMEVHQADLAQYVLYRAFVLRLLSKVLEQKDDGSYAKERALHSVVFPMRVDEVKQKNQLSIHNHQLWLIDEKYSFYDYVASDIELRGHRTVAGSQSQKRPDIAAYVFSDDSTEVKFNSVVIVEFKRPGNEDSKNPVKQIFKYIDECRNRVKDCRGIEMPIVEETRFYCYAICDLQSDDVREDVKDYEMIPKLDGYGYFKNFANRNAYVELISPNQLLKAAYKRNLSFFRKLKLPENLLKY